MISTDHVHRNLSFSQSCNKFIKQLHCPADGYIPLDALADPDDPDALIASYTTDGVHHTPAGQRALAALIPEDIFRAPQKEVSP